jgi:hypothetical protein|tara:strand:+ start:167 stop:859 length:693 start_codon:yes stop_codon:yes gene_type:complete
MATAKEYAYFLKGNKIAIVERDTAFDNDPNSKDFGPGTSRAQWKSPLSTTADGLELEYTYVPSYFIESTDTVTTTISGWDQDNDGNFRLRASGSTDWTTSPNLSAMTYFVLRKAGRFNGLHKVKSVTNNRIVTHTRISASTSETLFEETVSLYYDISVMNSATSEDFTIPITEYQASAMTYFVKAKIAEDRQDFEQYEYLMSKFKKMLEQNESAKIWGSRMILSGPNAIR